MNSINPSLASAAQSLQAYSQTSRTNEMAQSSAPAPSNPSSASTTVTLSSGQPQAMVDYTGINNQQMVRNTTQAQQGSTMDSNQTGNSGLTYASSLQNQSSYFLTQQNQAQTQTQSMANNTSGNTTENMANQNANLASQ